MSSSYIQTQTFDDELPDDIIKIENTEIDWQEKLACSILTRREVYVLTSKTDDYYVYVLWKMYSGKPIPFYVGKGHFDRIIKHEAPSDNQNKHKNNILNKHQTLGFDVGYSIISWHKQEEEAFAEEAKLIALIGRADLKQGSLTNKTDGGDGTRGHIALKRGESYSAKPVYAMINGQSTRFACLADCAEVLGTDSSVILARIRNGWAGYYYEGEEQRPAIEKFRGFYRKAVHTPQGVFESLAEAGRHFNVSHGQIYKWIKRGWEGFYYIEEGQRPRRRTEKAVKIAGVEFESQIKAALAFEIPPDSLRVRLKSSNYPDWIDLSGTIQKESKKQPVTAIWIEKQKYNSLMEAERAIGIKHATLAARAASSNYPDVIIEGIVKQQRSERMGKIAVSVTIDDKYYKTLSDASRSLNIDINTVKTRCRSLSFPNYNSTDPDLQKKPPKDGKPSLRKIIINGVSYRSINAASKVVNIARHKLKEMALDNSISNVYFTS